MTSKNQKQHTEVLLDANTKPKTERSAIVRIFTNPIVVGLYVVLSAALFYGLVRARDVAMKEYSTPEAQQEWLEYKSAIEKTAGGPVKRSPPNIKEPPILVMLRDRFAATALCAWISTSAVYASTAFFIAGAFMGKPFEPRTD